MNDKLKYKLGTTEILAFAVAVPSMVTLSYLFPNVSIADSGMSKLFIALVCFFAAMFGPIVGGLTGFLGTVCGFVLYGQSVNFSYAIATCLYGIIVGELAPRYQLREGNYKTKQIEIFIVVNALASIVAFSFVEPFIDFISYGEELSSAINNGVRKTLTCATSLNAVMAIFLYVVSIFRRDGKQKS